MILVIGLLLIVLLALKIGGGAPGLLLVIYIPVVTLGMAFTKVISRRLRGRRR